MNNTNNINDINNTNNLNVEYTTEEKIRLILRAYEHDKLCSDDSERVRYAVMNFLEDNSWQTGCDFYSDIKAMGGFSEGMIGLIGASVHKYPEFNVPLRQGYTECYWLFDNQDYSCTSLETYTYKSDWVVRIVEISIDLLDEGCDIDAFLEIDLDGIMETI